ncbi:hypothetical protein ACI5KX_10430 [Erythrobacter sp. GH1-10]|uniref:hypothetical protein n=1 Tax=Erythrobacter sp. GH1-10 TaxID=3349334 RepID=UPI003877AA08
MTSLEGVSVGMTIEQAKADLEVSGYFLVGDGDADCEKEDRVDSTCRRFVNARDPSFSYAILVDENCRIESMRRTRRGIEL